MFRSSGGVNIARKIGRYARITKQILGVCNSKESADGVT